MKDAIFVVGGWTTGKEQLSTIEMLGMRLNADLSFAFLRRTWSQTQPEHLTPCFEPFVSAFGDNSLLIYGGYGDRDLVSGGVLIDINRGRHLKIEQKNFLF